MPPWFPSFENIKGVLDLIIVPIFTFVVFLLRRYHIINKHITELEYRQKTIEQDITEIKGGIKKLITKLETQADNFSKLYTEIKVLENQTKNIDEKIRDLQNAEIYRKMAGTCSMVNQQGKY